MASRTPTVFLVFYRFKAMSNEEAQKSSAKWNDLKKSLPPDVRLAGEYNHAWGTETTDSCYLKRITPIHFWTGGLALKTRSDGMWTKLIQ